MYLPSPGKILLQLKFRTSTPPSTQLKDVPPPTPSVGQIKATLGHLNPKKATGADKLPAWLLKRFCEKMALVVHNIMCASIAQCKYSELYKHCTMQVP